ncbi:hypothetical protein GCM10027059_26010 [Myceligenerans halotolerans]
MFSDEELLELPPEVRLTGLGLRFYADDHGRGSANPTLIKAQLWPLTPAVDNDAIDFHLVALEDAGYLQLYDVDGRTYFVLAEWPKTDRAQPSRIPPPPSGDATPDTVDSSTQTLATSSRAARETPAVVGGRKEEGEEGRGGGDGGRGAAGGAGRTLADLAGTAEPSPFCSRHPIGTEDKCGPCGGARKRHEAWVKAQVDQESGGAA